MEEPEHLILEPQLLLTHFLKDKINSLKTEVSYSSPYTKAFDCMDHNKPWKILKEMGIPDHLTCLLRDLYAGQEAS